jgi:hypothetical protein
MKTSKNLYGAAIAGLMTASVMVAAPAFASPVASGNGCNGSCNGKCGGTTPPTVVTAPSENGCCGNCSGKCSGKPPDEAAGKAAYFG